MAKLEDDGLNLAMQDWKIHEVEVDPLLVANEFASIPGFHVVMKKTKETKFIPLLDAELAKSALRFPTMYFDRPTILKRNIDRGNIHGRKKKAIKDFQAIVRALNQEQSLLNETEQTDDNILALIDEKKTTRKLVDPKGVTAEISAKRFANRMAREKCRESNGGEEVPESNGGEEVKQLKRLKKNSDLKGVDDEALEVSPAKARAEDDAVPMERY